MFNDYFIYKDILVDYIDMAIIVYDLLGIPLHQHLFSTDIKYKYKTINMYLDDHYYLVFHMPGNYHV